MADGRDLLTELYDEAQMNVGTDETGTTAPPAAGAGSLFGGMSDEQIEDFIAAMAGTTSTPAQQKPTSGAGVAVTATGEAPGQLGIPVLGPGVTPEAAPFGWWGDLDPDIRDAGRMSRYTSQSARLILNGMSSSELDALEREFVRAGYIDEDALTTGRASLLPTFTNLVQTADTNRVSWEMQVEGDVNRYQQWLKDNPEEEDRYAPFVAPDYLKPDYATLAQRTKAYMAGELGRKPTSSEMALLTGFLDDSHRQEWQANVYDPSYGNWEKNARAYESGEEQGSETYQGVDAEARFAEYFDQRFEGELEHRDRVDQTARNSVNLFESIDTISRMI